MLLAASIPLVPTFSRGEKVNLPARSSVTERSIRPALERFPLSKGEMFSVLERLFSSELFTDLEQCYHRWGSCESAPRNHDL